MTRRITLLLLAIALVVVPDGTSWADHIIWSSPLTSSTADSRLTIGSIPGGLSVARRITTNSPGDLQWADFALSIPSDVQIDGVTLCYRLAASQSFISQIRLTVMNTPDFATVIHDDGTDLTDPGPQCVFSPTNGDPVEGTIVLSLRLNFASVEDWIDIGAIGIHVSPVVSGVGDGSSEPDGLSLRPNRPNPFGPSTTISYAVEQDGDVSVEIFDVNGRAVRTLYRGHQTVGEYERLWDGRSDDGSPVAAGTYYYRIQVGEKAGSRGMVLLR